MQISKREFKKYCHPRLTVKELLMIHRVDISEIKIDKKRLCKFLSGKGRITQDMAKEFGRVFSGGSQFFINLQKNYDEKIRSNKFIQDRKGERKWKRKKKR